MKILIVEDSENARKQYQELFRPEGYELLEAENGLEALGAIQYYKETIDIIICDVNMPKLDGLSVCEIVHRDQIKTAPIIMVTTELDPEMKRRGMNAGVRVWFHKPVDEDKLLSVVQKLT